MKEKTEIETQKDGKSKVKEELDVAREIYDVLLTVPPERRGPIIQAIAILLRISI